jgi:glutathione S-transferase
MCVLGFEQDPAVTSGNIDRVEALLMKLDRKLTGKNYLVDNRFTVADAAVGGDLLVISTCMPYVSPFDMPYQMKHPLRCQSIPGAYPEFHESVIQPLSVLDLSVKPRTSAFDSQKQRRKPQNGP